MTIGENHPRCNARTRQCRKCGHQFSKDEHDLWQCPECGEDRHCQQAVPVEGQRCRYHGGASPGGPAAPAYTHGRYSKYLPANLLTRYQDAQADPDLLSLREDVALLDTRIADLVAALGTGEHPDVWVALRATYGEMNQARASGDSRAMAKALLEMGKMIDQGAEQGALWAEINKTLDQRRKLVESESKRLVDMRQMLTVEETMTIISVLVSGITQYVQDRKTLGAIVAFIRDYLDRPDGLHARIGSGGAVIDAVAVRAQADAAGVD